jgi:NlpC/P60 family putative phage cell wall peptidase
MTREQILTEAREWLGTPYHHQGAVKGAGCDCLGFVRGVYYELYGYIPEEPPPYTPMWGEFDSRELMLEAASRNLVTQAVEYDRNTHLNLERRAWLIGDVLVFRTRRGSVAKHCAIVAESNVMLHSYSGIGVVETSIGVWSTRLAGIFSFPNLK